VPVAAPAAACVPALRGVALPPAAIWRKRGPALGVAGRPPSPLFAVFLVLCRAKRGALIEELPAQPVKIGAGAFVDGDLLPVGHIADFPRKVAPLGLVPGGKRGHVTIPAHQGKRNQEGVALVVLADFLQEREAVEQAGHKTVLAPPQFPTLGPLRLGQHRPPFAGAVLDLRRLAGFERLAVVADLLPVHGVDALQLVPLAGVAFLDRPPDLVKLRVLLLLVRLDELGGDAVIARRPLELVGGAGFARLPDRLALLT
jgi:hypothetical protein